MWYSPVCTKKDPSNNLKSAVANAAPTRACPFNKRCDSISSPTPATTLQTPHHRNSIAPTHPPSPTCFKSNC